MLEDPRTLYPPPLDPGRPRQAAPRLSSPMEPEPDRDEESSVGKGALAHRVALITGADFRTGRAVSWMMRARRRAIAAVSHMKPALVHASAKGAIASFTIVPSNLRASDAGSDMRAALVPVTCGTPTF